MTYEDSKTLALVLVVTSSFLLTETAMTNNSCEIKDLTANCSFRSLTDVPQALPVNIEGLLLMGNHLTTIKANSFYRYQHLLYLEIRNNQLQSLENHAFDGLSKLKVLDLLRNKLNYTSSVFPGLCFEGLTSLNTLHIGRNIPRGWFIEPDDSFSYPHNALRALDSLDELDVDGLPGLKFGSGFKSLKQLKKLSFSRCFLNYLPKDMFVNTPNIVHLRMSKCHIIDSHPVTFAKVPNMEFLDISNNVELGWENVSHVFQGLQYTAIRILNISTIIPKFSICRVPPREIFKYLQNTSLEEIICDHNSIYRFESGSLQYTPRSLKTASFKDNPFLFGVYVFEFISIKSMRRIDLSDCALQHSPIQPFNGDIPEYSDYVPIFSFPPNLEELIMRNTIINAGIPEFRIMKNSMKMIDISRNGISIWKGPVKGFDSLEVLDMSFNYCEKIFPYFFTTFPSLRVLNVSNNFLGEALMDPSLKSVFDQLHSLTVLDLSKNRFNYVLKDWFSELKTLTALNLSQNHLIQLDVNFERMNLRFLILRGNDIQKLDSRTRSSMDMMVRNITPYVDLSLNPLFCTCDDLSFLQWMISTKINFLNYEANTCADDYNAGKQLDESLVLSMKVKCTSYGAILFGGGCILMLILLIVAVGIVYRYRWRIRYLYYVVRDRVTIRQQHLDRADYKYDAFVSFADEDREFVQTLTENMESQGKEICLHFRDFKFGEYIGSNIVRAIQNSRYTVVILSENFLQSDWCRYEFEMARMEAVYETRNVLLIVKLENVETDHIPRELMYLMSSESYLEYPSDREDRETFWENLNSALGGE